MTHDLTHLRDGEGNQLRDGVFWRLSLIISWCTNEEQQKTRLQKF